MTVEAELGVNIEILPTHAPREFIGESGLEKLNEANKQSRISRGEGE